LLSITGSGVRLCDGISRRNVLRVGGLGFTGLLWSDWLRARATAAAGRRSKRQGDAGGKAKACILIFNYGGPSHLETFDPKPDAPVEIRGEFKTRLTSLPGIAISEHLPRLAARTGRYTMVRSVTHTDNDHAVGTYLALTGYSHPRARPLGIEPPESATDMPSMGSVLSKIRTPARPVFPYVTLGDLRHFGNHDSMGQNAGCLGKIFDPFTVPFTRPIDGSGVLDLKDATSVFAGLKGDSLHARQGLLAQMNRAAPAFEKLALGQNLDAFARRAYALLGSTTIRDAFDVGKEPAAVRAAYGPNAFGRSCLLARRLVEAGVPMVTVYSFGNRDWDTHGKNFSTLKNTLLPPTDQGVSALLDDLHGRGLLDETLVVWMGDMGRTPRINREAGRDHWSFCYSILLAGGGVRGGQVYGSSDKAGAYPSTNPVHPADVAATIYHCLGIDPLTQVTDQQGRLFVACTGQPISAILA
jgi:hypothetical protein